MVDLILNKIRNNINNGTYEPLSKIDSCIIEKYYKSKLKISLSGDLVTEFHTKSKTLIGKGYERVVIGGYGPYIELNPNQINKKNIRIKPSQKYRLSEMFINKVKYIWYESNDDNKIKIYYQKRKVKYADYKEGYFYISPDEVDINCNLFI